MATSINKKPQTSLEKSLTALEYGLASKERQLAQECGEANIDVDITTHFETLTSSPPATDITTHSKALTSSLSIKDIAIYLKALTSSLSITPTSTLKTDMRDRLKLDQKRKKAKENYDLTTETKPMAIPSEISKDKSLINSIKILDNASNKLPVAVNEPPLSQTHRANVSIKSSNDAWIYSLNPLEKLVLPKKRDDIQTTCRICNSSVTTKTPPTTDFLLCENHRTNLNKFASTIEYIYGGESQTEPPTEPPTEHTQFHLNLYGPVLNRLNLFIQQLKTKAAESNQDMKNIYEIMIDTNMMFKASFILYERYLNPNNMQLFFLIIMSVLDFAAAHQARIIEGLQGVENISVIVLDLCLLLATRLLVVTRVVTQTFFGFFGIQLNTIFENNIANEIWALVGRDWTPIIALILTRSIKLAILLGVVYLTYTAYKWHTQPSAINAEIDGDDLIVI